MPAELDGGWKLLRLNERFRFYKYLPQQRFKPHKGKFAVSFLITFISDGFVELSNGEKTFFTVLFYLNEGFIGGATNMWTPNREKITVTPSIGSILVFNHKILHEGETLQNGIKYVLRSDVFYVNKNIY